MNISLTPELERLVNDKVSTGLYQTASEVVGTGCDCFVSATSGWRRCVAT